MEYLILTPDEEQEMFNDIIAQTKEQERWLSLTPEQQREELAREGCYDPDFYTESSDEASKD